MTTAAKTNEQKYQALTALAEGDFQAYLYDCDGTLADNMGAHKKTYVRLAADEGVVIDERMIDELAGFPVVNVVKEINKRYGSSFDPATFAEQRERIFYKEYIGQTQPIAYVVDHLKAHAGKIKIAVVSGGVRDTVEKTLSVLGIAHIPDVLVCAGETPRGKPWPDPFLAAAEKLNVAPEHCLVFEDGDAGVQAAKAAGMRWIRIDKL